MSRDSRIRCFTRQQYYANVTKFAMHARSGDSITVATMSFKNEFTSVQDLLEALIKASKAGASVTIMVDAYTFMMPTGGVPGPLLLGRTVRAMTAKSFRRRLLGLDLLAQAGGTVIITNRPRRSWAIPVAGRSHMKFAVLNNDTFIGGCNLTDPSQIDLMILRRDDIVLASLLRDIVERVRVADDCSVHVALSGQDMSLQLDDNTNLLIDAGTPGKSIIEVYALQLISNASRRLMMTCQYPLSGHLLQHMQNNRAPHGSAYFYTNALLRHSLLRRLTLWPVYTYCHIRLGHIRRHTTVNRYLHAKLLIADEAMIVGSHNFIHQGVTLGTAEIALLSTDTHLIDEVQKLIYEQINITI